MLDKIMDMVGDDAINQITEKAGISIDQARKMMPLAKDSLQEGLMSQATSGNIGGIVGMFNSATQGSDSLMNNGIFSNIKNLFTQKILSNMNLPESVAGLAAGTGLSSIIGGLAGKMQEDGDNEDINATNIISVLGGSEGMLGNLKDMASGFLGNVKQGAENAGDSAVGTLKDIAGGLFGKK